MRIILAAAALATLSACAGTTAPDRPDPFALASRACAEYVGYAAGTTDHSNCVMLLGSKWQADYLAQDELAAAQAADRKAARSAAWSRFGAGLAGAGAQFNAVNASRYSAPQPAAPVTCIRYSPTITQCR